MVRLVRSVRPHAWMVLLDDLNIVEAKRFLRISFGCVRKKHFDQFFALRFSSSKKCNFRVLLLVRSVRSATDTSVFIFVKKCHVTRRRMNHMCLCPNRVMKSKHRHCFSASRRNRISMSQCCAGKKTAEFIHLVEKRLRWIRLANFWMSKFRQRQLTF